MERTDYQELLRVAMSLLDGESSRMANLANLSALLHERLQTWWTGFYLVEGDELVLGPFQGPVACTRIGHGKGVCGMAWAEDRVINVPDVDAFPGHIACSAESKSEIVLPLKVDDAVVAVLDIDSEKESFFGSPDQEGLMELVDWLESEWPKWK